MKILHVLAQLPEQTGSGVYYHNLFQGMADHGVENALIYAIQDPFKINFDNVTTFPVLFNSPELPFPIPGMSDVMPYTSTVYSQMTDDQVECWMRAFTSRLEQAKASFQPDLIISHHLWYLTSLVMNIFESCPIVGVSHGTDLRQARMHPELKGKYLADFNRLDLVFSLTEIDKESLAQEFKIDPHKIMVTGNGFNSDIFHAKGRSTREEEKIKLLYAGKLTQSKGVFELAQCFPRLKQIFPAVEMHFIGNGEDGAEDKLKHLAQADQEDGFYVKPAVQQDQLAEIMRSKDIFILPSYYEGLATICLEAMACGMRVVVSDLPPLRNFLGPIINQSGQISYVAMPRVINQDQAVAEDLPIFVADLTQAITEQIQAILDDKKISDPVSDQIAALSWPQIIERQILAINNLLK